MSKFLDALETRSPAERKSALATRLPQQIAHAKANTAYFAESLKHVDAATINSVEALAALPVVRKSDLIELQKTRRPFGGLEEGIIKVFMDAGFCVTNPTCGACLGMSNGVLAEGEVCASTTNRNFNGRMGKGGMVHLMSPATAAATAIAGHITNSSLFNG